MNKPFYHEEVPTTIRVLQAVGITATAFLAGQQAAFTYVFTPALLDAPAPLLVKQWQKSWQVSRAIAPLSSIGLGALFGYLAYREPSTSLSAAKFYTMAAILLPATIPYTIAFMGPINAKLVDKSESLETTALNGSVAEAGVAQEDTVHALVDKWATLNLGRALMTFAAAFSGSWASLSVLNVVKIDKIGFTTGANRIS